MRNGIIISVLVIKAIFLEVHKYIYQLTKDVRESTGSDDTNFSPIGCAE